MATNNRANQISKVLKVVKKHFKPHETPANRCLLDHLVVSCCLENSLPEDAEKVFHSLKNDYFDWNEVRVSTVRELGEVMKPLNDSHEAATRLKRVLQSIFETLYSFDLEPMKKQNLGESIKQLERLHGSTPFVVAYVNQHGLGGHSIPINQGLLECMRIVGVISDAEAQKGTVPGLERAVPKTKGAETSSLLHQLGVEYFRNPFGATIRKLLLEIEPECKDNLPKRRSKQADASVEEPVAPAAKAAPVKKKTSEKAGKKESTAKKAAHAEKKSSAKAAAKKKVAPTKKVVAKKVASTSRTKKTTTNKKLKKKPR